jgi:hypothetical protein
MSDCTRCGAELRGDAKFCDRCGFEVGTSPDAARRLQVVVTDIDLPFWSVVFLLVQWTIAAIPAAVVLGFLGLLAWGALRAFGMGA